MQLEGLGREGMNDSNHTAKKHEEHDIDLELHFKQNGLSDQAYAKIAHDVASGDISTKLLINCGDNKRDDCRLLQIYVDSKTSIY